MNKSAITIREMREDDLSAVRGLAEQLGYPISLADLSQRFAWLNKSSDHKLFVACTDAAVIGWVHVGKEMSSLLAADRADIGALVVDTQVRSQGIGANLMMAAEKWATDKNLKLMRVRSNMKRTDAHRFYQRQGYEIVKSWHLFTKALRDSER
ncbi:MAG: GNAT family N-acetyltransferase [Bdellovibrionaceae bacterium]|nr:GNAT family N-acetyltransferase [Pseudobdellovibrionaceae bacterium]